MVEQETTTTSSTPVAEAAKVEKPGTPKPLSQAEESTLLNFIGKCVLRNIALPAQVRFGVNKRFTVQDLCHESPAVLSGIRKSINKAIAEFDPEVDAGDELKISKLPATQWAEFILNLLRRKKYEDYAADLRARKKFLVAKINESKTPQELRQEAEQELAGLNAIPDEEDFG